MAELGSALGAERGSTLAAGGAVLGSALAAADAELGSTLVAAGAVLGSLLVAAALRPVSSSAAKTRSLAEAGLLALPAGAYLPSRSALACLALAGLRA